MRPSSASSSCGGQPGRCPAAWPSRRARRVASPSPPPLGPSRPADSFKLRKKSWKSQNGYRTLLLPVDMVVMMRGLLFAVATRTAVIEVVCRCCLRACRHRMVRCEQWLGPCKCLCRSNLRTTQTTVPSAPLIPSLPACLEPGFLRAKPPPHKGLQVGCATPKISIFGICQKIRARKLVGCMRQKPCGKNPCKIRAESVQKSVRSLTPPAEKIRAAWDPVP